MRQRNSSKSVGMVGLKTVYKINIWNDLDSMLKTTEEDHSILSGSTSKSFVCGPIFAIGSLMEIS
jgi:hypothetical protein